MKKKKNDEFSNTMYTGEEEVPDYEFEDEFDKKVKLRKRIGIALLLILVIVVVFLFLRACFTDTDIVEVSQNEKNLLAAGKNYYEEKFEKSPTEKGQCETVSLNTLILEGYIEKKNYVNCEGNNTYVKVCKVTKDSVHYTPVLSCDEIKTEFDNWTVGTYKDLVKDKSDVKFTYLGQKLDSSDTNENNEVEEYFEEDIPYTAYKKLGTTTYYRTRNKLYVWDLNKKTYYPGNGYYVSAPSSTYSRKDSGTYAYKWYKTVKKQATLYSKATWKESAKPTNPYTVYLCESTNNTKPSRRTSLLACSTITDYSKTISTYKACSGTFATTATKCCSSGELNSAKTSCGSYVWSSYTTSKCTVGSTCKTKTGTVSTNVYYPSGASSASGEKTYYTSSPASGYTNKTARSLAYKWYKLTKTGTSSVASNTAPDSLATKSNSYSLGDWSDWTTTKPKENSGVKVETKNKIKLQQIKGTDSKDWKDITKGYVSKSQLIKAFNDENITTLKNVNENGQVKYKYKMYYRNRKDS